MIPTAESIISDEIDRVIFPWIDEKPEQMKAIKHVAIEVAKLHVEAALKAASEKAKMKGFTDWGGRGYYEELDRESILSAYPLNNIK